MRPPRAPPAKSAHFTGTSRNRALPELQAIYKHFTRLCAISRGESLSPSGPLLRLVIPTTHRRGVRTLHGGRPRHASAPLNGPKVQGQNDALQVLDPQQDHRRRGSHDHRDDVLGVFAVFQMRTINAAAHEIQSSWLPSVRWLGEMRTQASRHRSNLRDHMLTTDPKIKQATDKLHEARMDDFTRAVKLYQPLISTDEERNLARELQTAWKDYIASVNEVLDYSRKGDNEMAIATNASTTIDLGRRTDALMAQLVELNYKGAETDGALAQAASRIGDVVKLITAVAEQTNLLALNATIEAARAGDAGRGFAVVASEVKALAAQTAKATEEISTQIEGMQNATDISVSAIREIGKTIASISEISSTIASAVEEQGAATKEIARNMQEAARLSTQVASNVTDVNKGAGETGSASTQVLVSAQSLSKESGQLRLEVDKFLTAMRAA